jgi:Flp pilus assembly protein TadG
VINRNKPKRIGGQAIAELSLALPLLLYLALGAADLGRAYFYHLPVSTAASAGARAGAVIDTADIGLAIRSQSSALPNNAATWGTTSTADCLTTMVASQACGDSGGCAASSSFWTSPPAGNPNPVACFAVRSCTLDTSSSSAHDGQCTKPTWGGGCASATSAWSTPGTLVRPSAGAALKSPSCLDALQVIVVYRFTAITPLIGTFFSGPGHALFISSTATIVEEY